MSYLFPHANGAIMFDSTSPFNISFVQKEKASKERDSFDYALIYKFYTTHTDKYQRLKYILRVEAYDDVFAIKFYAARDRKLDNRYNRIIKAHNYKNALRIFYTCASIIPKLLKEYPYASFAVNGAESLDLESDKVESRNKNQRFRIYRTIALNLFGRETFEHIQYEEISSYLLVNRIGCNCINEKAERIKQMFIERNFDV